MSRGGRRRLAARWRPPRLASAILVACVLAGAASPVAAQRFAVELRVGAAVGNYTETEAGLDLVPGPALAAMLEAELVESFSAYAGFTRSSFGCDEGFCTDRDVTLTSQGVVLGGRWSAGVPWVRAGVALLGLDVDATGASESSEAGLGWDLGAGLELDLGGRARIRPGVTYQRHGASTDLGDGHAALLALHVGFLVGLGGR